MAEQLGPISRRDFIQGAVAGAIAGAAGIQISRGAPRKRPPNILLIISDEHNAGVMGCYGNTTVQTPHLDRLSRQGITFDCAYTNSPLCCPSRLSLTSGKYISRVGAWSNDSWLPRDGIATLPRIMTAAGYESILCGKMHYDPKRSYGFREIGGSLNNYFKSGRTPRRHPDDRRVNRAMGRARFSTFQVANNSEVMQHDRTVVHSAKSFLAKRRPTDRPFFLLTGFLAPHFPLTVPLEFWLPYQGRIPQPKLPPGHVQAQPLNYHHLRRGFGVVNVDPRIVRRGRELYYGLTHWVDGQIGHVLKALDDSPLAPDTVVIYASDHGENMGEHALWWKNCMYDHAARVPLIISWPARWKGGQRRTGVCSLVDLVQTVAELGGARCPGDWDGDSMVAWMDDETAKWKDFAVSEYYAHNITSGFVMLRAGSYKYVYHTPADKDHPSERELYNLRDDPGEFVNLAGRPEHRDRVAAMHAALIKELGENPDETDRRCRVDLAKGYDRPPSDRPPVGQASPAAGTWPPPRP
ncbi:hypothetical protein LCGC14_1921280 [marine sediment metagenome]|uniref:Sulfatase N-terminal domain-containing protein n=1 Tax=marine sediment metagenome TaxID=412755 RepID=A0A0F9GE63_9ZZZZ